MSLKRLGKLLEPLRLSLDQIQPTKRLKVLGIFQSLTVQSTVSLQMDKSRVWLTSVLTFVCSKFPISALIRMRITIRCRQPFAATVLASVVRFICQMAALALPMRLSSIKNLLKGRFFRYIKPYFSIALATPCWLLLLVTTVASSLTASGALPIATPRPASRSIGRSLKLSPMVMTCSSGIW